MPTINVAAINVPNGKVPKLLEAAKAEMNLPDDATDAEVKAAVEDRIRNNGVQMLRRWYRDQVARDAAAAADTDLGDT